MSTNDFGKWFNSFGNEDESILDSEIKNEEDNHEQQQIYKAYEEYAKVLEEFEASQNQSVSPIEARSSAPRGWNIGYFSPAQDGLYLCRDIDDNSLLCNYKDGKLLNYRVDILDGGRRFDFLQVVSATCIKKKENEGGTGLLLRGQSPLGELNYSFSEDIKKQIIDEYREDLLRRSFKESGGRLEECDLLAYILGFNYYDEYFEAPDNNGIIGSVFDQDSYRALTLFPNLKQEFPEIWNKVKYLEGNED